VGWWSVIESLTFPRSDYWLLLVQGGPAEIEHIVEQTGGDTIRSDDLGTTFPEMMHRIRSRYSLYYRMPEGTPGSLRTIHVKLSAGAQQRFPEARVAARKGYRFGARDEHGFTKR
jgi:hypothetical protein